ncbi:GGDEF domain-containing protein [Xanthobacter sp. KR7-225]|uniref:GGDEF domain-containing protein n=1 Tax=Xanthobacter sp. KR7-225 TaxID=3156613 RepID=UPI0032B521DA
MTALLLSNVALLLVEMVAYFAAMLALFRARTTLGIGAFFCALGSLHFMETYLAASYYVALPFGVSLSPGSVVMFAGKLALLLLVYIREDAVVARQPIYGLMLGNAILLVLVALLRTHYTTPAPGAPGDLAFMDQIGVLMAWSTLLLFIDCLALILVYERLSRLFRGRLVLTIWLALALVLTLDQIGFFAVLNLSLGVPLSAGIGGWAGKLAAAAVYAGLLALYLTRFERPRETPSLRISDVFDVLTYRQKYEKLEIASRHDALTQVLHRGQFDQLGHDLLAVAATSGQPLSLLLVDVDGFKEVNDGHGHPVGDEVLRRLATTLKEGLRRGDYVVRYGGDEFAVFTPGVNHNAAMQIAAMLRNRVEATSLPPGIRAQSVSIGIATTPDDGQTLTDLLATADKRLYAAKDAGRDRIVGAFET